MNRKPISGCIVIPHSEVTAPVAAVVVVLVLTWVATTFMKLTGAEVAAIMVATAALLPSVRKEATKRSRR
ncbi:hypothetical protein [Micromonospora sp. U21]|uniref:hypothetical protein n=1 Tax=Micromonospora sp. U21 TaxID=2824899 RepID=UPI001B37F4AA|nr:hypothetical protein [Micromonospora sp. U21]MBQ0905785.1 hypothetical protein [Micromonospora sp. U21]